MNWFPILAILSGSLVYLIYNYLPNQDLLKDNWNKFFYSFIWIITSGIIIISHATPEWTAETTLLFYIAAGFSLPQMLLIILSNKSLKEENKDASDKLEQKEKDYNKLLEECESEKTYRTNLCKNHDTMLKGTVDSLILRDANFFFHLKVLKIDTDQLNEVLNIRLTNMKTIPTFTEKKPRRLQSEYYPSH